MLCLDGLWWYADLLRLLHSVGCVAGTGYSAYAMESQTSKADFGRWGDEYDRE